MYAVPFLELRANKPQNPFFANYDWENETYDMPFSRIN